MLLANNGRDVYDTNILRQVFRGEHLGKVQEVARFDFTIAELEIRLSRESPSGNRGYHSVNKSHSGEVALRQRLK